MENIAITVMESIGGVLVNDRIVMQHHCAVLGQELTLCMEKMQDTAPRKMRSDALDTRKQSVTELHNMESKLKDQETVIENLRLELRGPPSKQEYVISL
jgi:hypothetical protein